ncbi:porin [Wenzhouxiangella sp. XN24]|uniref:OprO/OprP family phosphate-selective porin n=1 Tax=Wenzhouxiangella sp. XN24 TaxID=2713569 RepID=UPI0013ECB809|nr:porin [Wenzhouxiangella sp. XN24]NGX17391.1 porin [Wenzhouxiangella sp. XN24]
MPTRSANRMACVLLSGSAVLSFAVTATAAPEFDVRGRVHLDYALHDDDQIDLDDGFLFRRTFVGVQGTINENWSGIIEYDFSENGTNAQDVVLRRKLSGGTLKIGNFKVPMGLEEVASTNNIWFIERSSPNTALVDARRIGIGYDYFEGAIGFQGMAYGRGLGSNQEGDEPLGIAGRFVFAPVLDGNQLHLAASFAYEDVRDYNVKRFRDRPEARVDGTRLVDTGSIPDVDKTMKYGVEAAYQSGPFAVQTEYFGVGVDRNAGAEPDFSGWYVQGSWIVTGEKRGYGKGIFRSVKPGNPDRGAWEVTARYSALDLNDTGFQGGEQENLTLGLTYYSNPNVRFMLNYIMVDVTDSGAVVDGSPVGDESPNILIGRAQYSF